MKIPRFPIRQMAQYSNGLLATHIGYLIDDARLAEGLWAELSSFAIEHGIKPVVSDVFPFKELHRAHTYIESRKSYGKVVLEL
jgi:NADPH:quinone reductase-like Zn-dependent oxidoreductase